MVLVLAGCASAGASAPKAASVSNSPHDAQGGEGAQAPSLGWQLYKERRFAEAKQAFEADLKKEPGNVVASIGLAEVYRHGGDLERAAVVLRQSAALNPANADVRVELSEVYGEMKRFKPAVDESMEALQRGVSPETGAVLKYNLACYQARLGNQRTALWWLRQALEAGFSDYDHLQNDPDLESLRATAAYRELLSP